MQERISETNFGIGDGVTSLRVVFDTAALRFRRTATVLKASRSDVQGTEMLWVFLRPCREFHPEMISKTATGTLGAASDPLTHWLTYPSAVR